MLVCVVRTVGVDDEPEDEGEDDEDDPDYDGDHGKSLGFAAIAQSSTKVIILVGTLGLTRVHDGEHAQGTEAEEAC